MIVAASGKLAKLANTRGVDVKSDTLRSDDLDEEPFT